MADPRVRIQLCGRVCAEIDGTRRETRLPGPQGRRMFAFLVLRRMHAGWPFFRTVLSNMAQVLSKSDMGLAARYSELVRRIAAH